MTQAATIKVPWTLGMLLNPWKWVRAFWSLNKALEERCKRYEARFNNSMADQRQAELLLAQANKAYRKLAMDAEIMRKIKTTRVEHRTFEVFVSRAEPIFVGFSTPPEMRMSDTMRMETRRIGVEVDMAIRTDFHPEQAIAATHFVLANMAERALRIAIQPSLSEGKPE